MSANMSIHEYNLTLGSSSPFFTYQPYPDGPESLGWNSSYTSSNTWDPNNLYGTGAAYRRTVFDGSQVSIEFTGTGIYLCFNQGSFSYIFSVDQQPLTTVGEPDDAACTPFAEQGASVGTLVYARGLTSGNHNATLELTPGNTTTEFHFFGGMVTLDAGNATWNTSTPQYINNNSTQWTYAGLGSIWLYRQNSETTLSWDADVTLTCIYAQSTTASCTFYNASAVWLLGQVEDNTIGYSITLDGRTSTYNASNFYIEAQQVLFAASGLDPTVYHTMIVTNFDANQPQGSGLRCVDIDALVTLQSTPPLPPPPPPPPTNSTGPTSPAISGSSTTGGFGSSTPVGVIAGSVVGGLAAIALLGLSLFYLRRRQLREQAELYQHALAPEELPLPSPFITPLPSTPASRSTDWTYATEAKMTATSLPSPGLVSVLEQQSLSYAELPGATMEKVKAGRNLHVINSEDTEGAASGSNRTSRPAHLPPGAAIPSAPVGIFHSTSSATRAVGGHINLAASGERRIGQHNQRLRLDELQHPRPVNIVQMINRSFSSRGRHETDTPPPGYEEARRP